MLSPSLRRSAGVETTPVPFGDDVDDTVDDPDGSVVVDCV
jgi:hypothetical protein